VPEVGSRIRVLGTATTFLNELCRRGLPFLDVSVLAQTGIPQAVMLITPECAEGSNGH
jgi:hypothetical protein